MKKTLSFILTLIMVIGVLTGCSGTPIIYHDDCTCPDGSHNSGETDFVPTEGSIKTGLAIVTSIKDSENAKHADYDVTLVAVTVD
ncbi:MAG: hypothetical protein IJA58_04840, partial [Lachnospiraceae bacterium]|nr:hypothetical protein [Lachnospiraceae bacterium]